MQITTVLSAHKDTELVQNTINLINKNVGGNLLTVIDGIHWDTWGKNAEITSAKLRGYDHNYTHAPYKNVAYGLLAAAKEWQDSDWFCYTEYDTMFLSSSFKNKLKSLSSNVWCAGNDLRGNIGPFTTHFNKNKKNKINWIDQINHLSNTKIKYNKYLLGCCVFYRAEFIHYLVDSGFFDRFLHYTSVFKNGFFPGYQDYGGYDLSEHLFPTLAHVLGRRVHGFASWINNSWYGDYKTFMMRWQPEIQLSEVSSNISILHPVKTLEKQIKIRNLINERRKDI